MVKEYRKRFSRLWLRVSFWSWQLRTTNAKQCIRSVYCSGHDT